MKEVSIVVIIADICFLLRAGTRNVDMAAGDCGTDLQKESKVQKRLIDITGKKQEEKAERRKPRDRKKA